MSIENLFRNQNRPHTRKNQLYSVMLDKQMQILLEI